MPGLIGFVDKHHKYDGKMLLNMRRLMKHFNSYIDDDLYFNENIYASRTHLGIIHQGRQPYVSDNRFFSWMEGEFYNQQELRVKYNVTSGTDNELLVIIYNKTRSFDFLKYIDGCYAVALYDKKKNKVYLITDRYGFKPLYWGIIRDDLMWSSELKGFLGHKNFKPVIDEQAVEEFFDIGYLLENRTWFEGVELVPPASTLIFDLKKSKVRIEHYWSWSEIKSIQGPIDERELVEELGRLFKQSVCRRINSDESVGITLSGGLDSRAILAAVPEDYKPLHAFTFGQKGCEDIKIASKVSRLKGATHHILEINSNNWLVPRISSIWKSDASFNMLHMHGIEFCDKYKSYVNFILDGILGGVWGDAVIGGLYSNMSPNQSEEYIAENRGRRFVNQSLILAEAWLGQRRPFASKDLVDLALSIPENLRQHSENVRKNSYIYKKMLLRTFPEYYNNIPWQKTGCPINYPKIVELLVNFKYRIVNKFKRESQRFGFNFKNFSLYTDYPSWIRQEPAKSFFEKVLLSKDAIYPEYKDKNIVHAYVRNHMERRGNYHDELCSALTFELWLQQVFENRFRE